MELYGTIGHAKILPEGVKKLSSLGTFFPIRARLPRGKLFAY
jgi:hypothetical protein